MARHHSFVQLTFINPHVPKMQRHKMKGKVERVERVQMLTSDSPV